ncbi:MAG: anaerobic ribonucleoside-triphosphate reductase [Candidatus Latescibacteria bacterium]|nr:anaerobic ribonucleoside-triphosphate reductase [Candidatus Latescibacterota bacterium]
MVEKDNPIMPTNADVMTPLKAVEQLTVFRYVEKRDGKIHEFNKEKITAAIFKAARSVGGEDRNTAAALAEKVIAYLVNKYQNVDKIPFVEEIQDAIEKILIEQGHAQTAKSFILYREKRTQLRKKRVLEKTATVAPEATEYALFVRTSDERILQWDRTRIVSALIREANLSPSLADKISNEVQDVIVSSGVKMLTSSLVREVVNAKLIENGLGETRKYHTRLGVPMYDVEKILLYRNKENANTPHNPEATNMTLAESIKKQFALANVFSEDVAEAHRSGDIHLHDLGFIDRPYCSGQSLEYVKKFGLSLPSALSIAKPAKHPETLLAHMVKFSAALQGHFAGAIGWDAVNLYFAPFLTGMSDRDLHQLAQMLIFEYSQQNVARGGQAIFSDINLYWEVPKHFENTPAVGPGGELTGKKYIDYLPEAQRFVKAIFDVYLDGDGTGRPFFFPKPLMHITERFFQTPGWEDFLNHICHVASVKGNTYFVLDRGETAKISECCRLSFKLEQSDLDDAATPWKMRYSAIQNVTLNLPRAAYVGNYNDEKLFAEIKRQINLAVQAHIQKRKFLEKLLELKNNGPLALLTMDRDGEPYLRMHRVTYLIGMLGLNEMVEYHLGKELHEDEEAYRFGLKTIAFINRETKRLSAEYSLRFVLEQTPAESTAFRFAKLDLEHFPKQTTQVIKGSPRDNAIYYTNSTYLNVGLPIDPIERVEKEGRFHDMIEAGALTHIWLADSKPSGETIANFVTKAFRNTRNAQIAFSPEFTSCNNCFKTTRGLVDVCPYCQTNDVDHITRVTGYFSRVSGWNLGKKAELKDRYKKGIQS